MKALPGEDFDRPEVFLLLLSQDRQALKLFSILLDKPFQYSQGQIKTCHYYDIPTLALPHSLNQNLTNIQKVIVYCHNSEATNPEFDNDDLENPVSQVQKILIQTAMGLFLISGSFSRWDTPPETLQFSEIISSDPLSAQIMAPVLLAVAEQTTYQMKKTTVYFVARSISESIDTIQAIQFKIDQES